MPNHQLLSHSDPAVAFGLDQLHVAENAWAIADQVRELYDRVTNVFGPIAEVGRQLDKSAESYNRAVASLGSGLGYGHGAFGP